MYQNQTTDNDLQKAIDDITNTTNIDPVFSDPVAAPSSVPEGDTGELGEAIGPFPEPKVEMVTPSPEPIAPFEPIDIPELNVPTPEPAVAPGPMPMPAPSNLTETIPMPTPPAPTEMVNVSESITSSAPIMPEPSTAAPSISSFANTNLSTRQVKEAALRDLVPLLNHLNMTPSQRFNICRNIFEDLRDYTILDQAYHAATEITNETERAEALLYLIESIDKM